MAGVGRLVKELFLKELDAQLSVKSNFIITSIGRLKASEADSLRQKLYAFHSNMLLVPRRLGMRAIKPLGIVGLEELMEGSIGLVLPGEETLPVAKLIADFVKTHEDQLGIRGAVIDGQLLDKSRFEQLANLAPRPVLLAQVLAAIESPIADVAYTLERLYSEVAWIAQQAAAKKPAEAVEKNVQAADEAAEQKANDTQTS